MSSIRMRSRLTGDTCELRAMINHPMRTQARDGVDKYIQTLVVEHNGGEAVRARWGSAIAENPFLSMEISGVSEGDTLTLRWEDTDGDSDTATVTV
ncbi:thiosulfate oxidation carrier complex protein SoxZ [Alkalilimnicola ehrlichii MLHE-1]|uniref:Sulfur compound chelating protein SoxZ n=1 Tax=Alkalilimnicola ehrlichii (strain ATCC BAA-1101 / DSM 17681 / MLHE-1) TaxID=187272 RepID=Q0A809_ALKEH|nr:thiosulfate oxidation carrier complex protein SoxZ [Alkalilimnicola ehrlichii]ABI57028.1 sulfur compound chelating protein SoxZ [Alkalilimnicola ehrlichii MLHE-1]